MHGSSIEVFYSYAHEDASFRTTLEKHLSLLHRQGLITAWHDRQIVPGTDWRQTIDTHLERASVILLLISADFLASDYCYGIEMHRALERHRAKQACVIPILLRPVDWRGAPFAHLQALPTNAKAVTIWKNRDAAFADVAAGLRRAIEDLSLLEASAPRAALPAIWNVPYSRNSLFLGREEIFSRLRTQLQSGQTTALSQPQAISGLGGIGKTQIAVEYAYRYYRDYQAVLWARAESAEALVSSYVALARLLTLPEQEARDQAITVQAVKTWLQTHRQWLLILDNADDFSLIPDFLPQIQLGGHLLLTTRAQALGGLANRIEVNTLDQVSGTLLLLRRAGLLAPDDSLDLAREGDLLIAQKILRELDGLPLAIDQAGAYLEETHCGLNDYLHLFRTQSTELLKQRGGVMHDHTASVYTTFTLAISEVIQNNVAADDLLRVVALLHPDAMPEELFRQRASYLGQTLEAACTDPLTWNKLLATVCAYSLLQRQSREQTLSIHRLVQSVLQARMSDIEHVQWTHRVISALEAVFPQSELATWRECERLVPHTLSCAAHVQSWKHESLKLASLLCKTADYLYDRAQYKQAEPLYERALRIREQELGPEHPDVAYPLHGLANLSYVQGKYEQAELLYQRALRMREDALGPTHLDVTNTLNHLAVLYKEQGKYVEAKALYERALRNQEQVLGPEHPQVATLLHNLADLYAAQKKYVEAEPLYERALHIREQALGPERPEVAISLHGLANLFWGEGKYAEAEPLFQRAIRIREQTLGPERPEVAFSLNDLGELYKEQGKYAEAELLLQRALRIREQGYGPEHPRVTYSLNDLADLYKDQGKYAEAEQLYQRALRIREQIPGFEHPDIAYPLYGLANLSYEQRKYEQAESLYQRALRVWELNFGPDHFEVAYALHGLANLSFQQGRYEQAESLYERALHVWEVTYGPNHPLVAEVLHDFAGLRKAQGYSEKAHAMYQRSLAVREQALGPAHPKAKKTRECLQALGKTEETANLEAAQQDQTKKNEQGEHQKA